MSKKYIWIASVFILVILVVFFTKSFSRESGPIKIGAILNLTGSSASQGENSQKAIDMAVAEINSAGGVLGRQVQMDYQDNMGDNPKGGLTAFYNLINKGVKLIIGPNQTPTGNVIAPLVMKNDAVMITPSVGSEKFAEAGPRTFNTFPPNKFDSFAIAEYLYDKGYRKIAVFGSQQEWEHDQANFVKQKFEEKGGQVVAFELPLTESKDLNTESLKIKSANPEAIVFTDYGQTAIASKRLRELGVVVPFYSVLLFPFQIDGAQGSLENTVFVATDTTNKEFEDKFSAKYNNAPNFPASQAYDAVKLMVKAIEVAKSTKPEKVADALSSIKDYKGVSGDLKFDADGNAHKEVLFYQVKDGKIVPFKK